jgi:hypothetical protein
MAMMVIDAFDARFLSLTAVMADVAAVDAAIQRLIARWGMIFSRSSGALDLASIYEIAPPAGGAHMFKLVLYAPAASPTVCIIVTNLQDGWSSLSHNVAKELGAPQIQVTSTERGAYWSGHHFRTWRDGAERRVVMVIRDSDKWVFSEEGEPESFETPSFYKRRLKRDRLTREVLVGYLRQLGCDPTDRGFWETDRDAIYFRQRRHG